MTDIDIWTLIQLEREKIGISKANLRKMRSNGYIPDKWVATAYLALKDKYGVSIEAVQSLAKPQHRVAARKEV